MLAARALGQGGVRAADVPAAGEEAPQPRPARRGRRRQGLEASTRSGDARRALGKQPYLVGKDVTLADFSVAAPLFYARGDMPLGPYAHVRDWFDRVSALPCWRRRRNAAPRRRDYADERRRANASACRRTRTVCPRPPSGGSRLELRVIRYSGLPRARCHAPPRSLETWSGREVRMARHSVATATTLIVALRTEQMNSRSRAHLQMGIAASRPARIRLAAT